MKQAEMRDTGGSERGEAVMRAARYETWREAGAELVRRAEERRRRAVLLRRWRRVLRRGYRCMGRVEGRTPELDALLRKRYAQFINSEARMKAVRFGDGPIGRVTARGLRRELERTMRELERSYAVLASSEDDGPWDGGEDFLPRLDALEATAERLLLMWQRAALVEAGQRARGVTDEGW